MARKKLQGQVAIITGASRGLGTGIAERFVRAGAAVVITARSTEQLDAEAERLRALGGNVLPLTADVSDPEQVQMVVDQTIDMHNRVDILVNNAGVIWPVEEVVETDPDEWVYNLHVNLIGPFYAAYCVLPAMLAQGYGRIVNISSGLARSAVAGLSAYGTAKAGVDQMTRIMALETAKAGVMINALHPGVIDTDMQTDLRSIDTSDSSLDLSMFHDYFTSQQLVSPYVASRLVYWLVGPWSKGRTGEIFTFRDEAWVAQVERDLQE
ncbi:MAG: SDR family oxidoreductase [Caldilineaceae bacterium]|nr:SDR family oxidoreductase [Caldilineaceae bacterium]